jgi:hypothetical protein
MLRGFSVSLHDPDLRVRELDVLAVERYDFARPQAIQ